MAKRLGLATWASERLGDEGVLRHSPFPALVVEAAATTSLRRDHRFHPALRPPGCGLGATGLLACLLPGLEAPWLRFSRELLPERWEVLRHGAGSSVLWSAGEDAVLLELVRCWDRLSVAPTLREAFGGSDVRPLKAHSRSRALLRVYVRRMLTERSRGATREELEELRDKLVVLEPPPVWIDEDVAASQLELAWRERRRALADGGVEEASALGVLLCLFGVPSRRDVPGDVQRAVVEDALSGAILPAAARALPDSVAFELACRSRSGGAAELALQMLAASADYGDLTCWDHSVLKTLVERRCAAAAAAAPRRPERRFVVVLGGLDFAACLVAGAVVVVERRVDVYVPSPGSRTEDGPRGGRSRSPSTTVARRRRAPQPERGGRV